MAKHFDKLLARDNPPMVHLAREVAEKEDSEDIVKDQVHWTDVL